MVWKATLLISLQPHATYLESQLQATQSFGNGLGSITATPHDLLLVKWLSRYGIDNIRCYQKGINTRKSDYMVLSCQVVQNPEAVTSEVIPLR